MADRKMPQAAPEERTAGENTISSAQTPGPDGTNPFTHERTGATGGTGGVNPSDTTIGTEGWGLGESESSTTGRGQGQLGRTERDQQPLGDRTFRCADVGNGDCRWETAANTDDELMTAVEKHGREAHGMDSLDAQTRRKFMNAIRQRRAA